MTKEGKHQNTTIDVPLTSKFKAGIVHREQLLTNNETTYAINWFNTKTRWLYDLYNFLAGGSVRKIGGVPFFKARLREKLIGDDTGRRDVLLIVQYPALMSFKNMLQSRVFQLVSILRSLAVADFTFGFSKRRDSGGRPVKFEKSALSHYAVIHFSGSVDFAQLLKLGDSDAELQVIFASEIAGGLATGKVGGELKDVPCIMHGIAVLQSVDQDGFTRAIESAQFETIKTQADQLFFGIYDRIF